MKRRQSISDINVTQIFESLGIATQEQRDKFLSQALNAEPNTISDIHYITRLSNNSERISIKDGE